MRQVSNEQVADVDFWDQCKTAVAATAMASRCLCGEGETVARSVNSGVQMESGQKLTI